jgi:hypothetical protein
MFGTLGEGHVLLADCAYDCDAFRPDIAACHIWANITSMPNRKRRSVLSACLCGIATDPRGVTWNKLPLEVRDRNIHMMGWHRANYGSVWAAMTSVAGKSDAQGHLRTALRHHRFRTVGTRG